MSAGLDHVFEALHDVILERFRASHGGEIGSASVAFEFGTPIPADTFKLNDPARTVLPDLAIEFMSQHANTMPEVTDMLFRRRPFTVDAQYGLMLGGSMPIDAASTTLLGAVKRDAEPRFDTQQGSLIGPYRYRPVYSTPVNWYDETDSTSWTHIAIERDDNPPPPVAGTPTLNPKLRMWRIASDALRPALAQPVSTTTLQQIDIQPSLAVRELVQRPRAQMVRERFATPMDPGVMMRTGAATRFSADRGAGFARESATNVTRASHFTELSGEARVLVPQPDPPPAPATAVAKLRLDSLVARDASWRLAETIDNSPKQQEVVADKFGIKVDICLINLQRPWLSDALLTLPGWFVPGFEKGEFSNQANPEDGPFALLPTACIVIRNLQITAQWSDEDHSAIEQSVNLGGFSLFGRTFDRNSATLTVPGMQSIAWVCEPMPLLPPESAPAS